MRSQVESQIVWSHVHLFSWDKQTLDLQEVVYLYQWAGTAQKATIHQVTTMLATSKNVLFPGHNYMLTTGADDPTLWFSPEC